MLRKYYIITGTADLRRARDNEIIERYTTSETQQTI